MNASEIFSQLPPAEAAQVLEAIREEQKGAYKSALGTLAARRKLRPVFLERKARAEKHEWMREALSRPGNQDLATELLQSWLLASQKEMICSFLDSLGVPHDGQGVLETLPGEPSRDRLEAAVRTLLENYQRAPVFIYLHLFAAMDITDWPALREILESQSELQFATATP